MSDLPLSKTLREMRERGLENVFQRFYSFYQGKVSSVDDDLQLGRSRVQMESLGYGETHEEFSDVITPYGGEDFGFYFPPYKGDNVLVTFDHGDISSPIVVGGSWATDGQQRVQDSELPTEFVSTTTNAEGNEVGSAPAVRGIKVRRGSALVFDETEGLEHVELWAGETQGKGNRAVKHSRLRLDDRADNGQIVLATFGDANSNAEQILGTDTADERDRKELEGRLRHQLIMRDTSSDRFVQVKTIGGDDQSDFHQMLMSDTQSKVLIKSANEHFIEIDDANDKTEWSVKDGFRWLIDQSSRFMLGETPGGRSIRLDDANSTMSMASPEGQTFKFDSTETLIQDTQHDINVDTAQNLGVDVGADANFTITGGATFTVGTNWLANVQAAFALLVTGTVSIQGASVTIDSGQVTIGQGSIQRLLNETALATFNSHTHLYQFPVHTSGVQVPTATPLPIMVPGSDTTVTTSAG